MQRSSSSPTRTRRLTTVVATAAAAGLVLAGCAGDGGGDTSNGGGDQTLKVLIAAPQEGAGKILQEEFESTHDDVEVDVEVVPYDQIQSKVTLDAQSGTNNYDVIQYWYPTVGALAEAGALVPTIDRRYPLEEIAEAHRHSESGRARGKIVVTLR